MRNFNCRGTPHTNKSKDCSEDNVHKLVGITAEGILAWSETSSNQAIGAGAVLNKRRRVEVGISTAFELDVRSTNHLSIRAVKHTSCCMALCVVGVCCA